jgi:hypothetical protein
MMNVDAFTMFCVVSVVCVFCVALFYFLNTNVSFANAKPNSVYNFDYIQPVTGGIERFLVKVVSNEKWTEDEIWKLDIRSDYRSGDCLFRRGGHLVNCVMPNGEYRRFWTDSVINCRKVPVGGMLYRFASFI